MFLAFRFDVLLRVALLALIGKPVDARSTTFAAAPMNEKEEENPLLEVATFLARVPLRTRREAPHRGRRRPQHAPGPLQLHPGNVEAPVFYELHSPPAVVRWASERVQRL